MEGEGEISVIGSDRMMDSDQFCAIRESAFDLHFQDHRWHTCHNLVSAQQLASKIHQFSNAFTLTNEFEELGRNQCDCLGIVQAKSAREAFLCYKTRVVEQ